MTSLTTPLPCPYCGATASVYACGTLHAVQCGNRECNAMGPDADNDSAAVEAWNRVAGGLAEASALYTETEHRLAAVRVELDGAEARAEKAEEALRKINDLRNSIIAFQIVNWSEHVYPLVAALDGAGIEGMPYPEARANFGTIMERCNIAKAQRDSLAVKVEQAESDARILAHAYTHDSRPPDEVVKRALGYDAGRAALAAAGEEP